MFVQTITLIFGMVLSGAVALVMFSGCSQPTQVLLPQDTAPEMGAAQASSPNPLVPVRQAPRAPTWEVEVPVARAPQLAESVLTPLPSEMPQVVTAGQMYTVKKGDSLWALSKRFGVSVAAIANANQISKDACLKIGQTLVIPDSEHASVGVHTVNEPQVGAVDVDQSMSMYTVRQGDTLSKIAQRHHTKVSVLKNLNQLPSDTIRVGQKLYLPGPSSSDGSSSALGGSVVASSETYAVRSGDTLSVIAERTGCKVADLMALNGIEDARSLRAGQDLKLPKGSHAAEELPPSEYPYEPIPAKEPLYPEPVEPQPLVPQGFGDDELMDFMDAPEVVPVE